jgi:RNA recognition motif. (a.k.a. RRM, RBD, or RNP domain)
VTQLTLTLSCVSVPLVCCVHRTNADLYELFSRYGEVISARIMVDKATGRSRGFGFVSFNNPDSADEAIRCMNGYHIGHKRLKVQHKKEKDINSMTAMAGNGSGMMMNNGNGGNAAMRRSSGLTATTGQQLMRPPSQYYRQAYTGSDTEGDTTVQQQQQQATTVVPPDDISADDIAGVTPLPKEDADALAETMKKLNLHVSYCRLIIHRVCLLHSSYAYCIVRMITA